MCKPEHCIPLKINGVAFELPDDVLKAINKPARSGWYEDRPRRKPSFSKTITIKASDNYSPFTPIE